MNRPQPHHEVGVGVGAGVGEALGRVGRYELLRPLGAGGMREVFLARVVGAAGFEARVVIKRILPHLAQDPAFVRRFVDEGKLTATLRHAGIAQVLDLGVEDGVVYLAMEYVDGRDLRALTRLATAYGPAPSVALRVHILTRVLEALDFAHRATDEAGRPAGVIHRDVSPSNVMLSRAGEVKLLDFGIARAISRTGGATTTGTIQGKYGYMSPEQAAGAHLDPRSDQFSVGVMAWELFAGRRPFDGPNDLKTLDNVRTAEPGPLHAAAAETPPEVSEAVARMLSKAPEGRFPTADDARRALQAYLNRVGEAPGTRDVAQWVEAVGQAAPPDAGEGPLSLDEALRLSLDGPRGATPGVGWGAGGGGAHTATAAPVASLAPTRAPSSAPAPRLGDTPQPGAAVPAPSGVALTATQPAPAPEARGGAVPSASPGPLGTGTSPPSPDTPPQATGFPPSAAIPGAPTTVTVVSPARRSFTALLVGFNVLLLGAVAVLLLQTRDAPAGEPAGEATAAERGAASGGKPEARPEAAPNAGIKPGPNPGASALGDAAADVGRDAGPDAGPDVGPDVRPDAGPDVRPDAGPDVRAPVPGLIPITLRPSPGDAIVAVPGGSAKEGARRLLVPAGRSVRVTVRREGYHSRVVTVRGDGPRRLSVRLAKEATGKVAFRFFPASAEVRLDGRAVKTGGANLLRRTLPVGEHKLVLRAGGVKKVVRFEVRDGATTNLRTLRLEAAPKP